MATEAVSQSGPTTVKFLFLSIYILSFFTSAVSTLVQAIREKRILTLITFVLYLPYIMAIAVLLIGPIYKPLGWSHIIDTETVLTATSVFPVDSGLG